VSVGSDEPRVSIEGPSDGEFRWVIVISGHQDRVGLDALISEGLERIDHDTTPQLWISDVEPGDDPIARAHGFVPYRDLWQLRCALPTTRSTIETRAFETTDLSELVEVNSRAFHWHPEQGGRTTEDLAQTMAEPWFDAEGLRLHHLDGRLAGFCWTKVHADHDPPIGEIFVIAVDPRFHGQGLGVPMTLAGLDWLSDRGLDHGMLYVEADNAAANATYTRIGFTHHQTNRAYRRDGRQ
jgi:mycothiol synthase